jgi:hypothetical protein
VSRYALIRKRLAPVAFLLGMGALVHHTCTQAPQRIHATVVLEYGARAAEVRRIDAELVAAGEHVAAYQRTALPGMQIGETKLEVSSPEADAELRIDVQLDERAVRITRPLRIDEGATIRLPLEADLGSPSGR